MAIFWQRQNRAHWKEQLALRDPSLVLLQYGTNESEAGFNRADYEAALGDLVDEVKEVSGGAAVLIVAPLDRAMNRSGRLVTRPIIMNLVASQQRVAIDHGVAFWNTFEAMGGEGSMAAWTRARPELGGSDLTHPTPLGAEVLGDMLSDALIHAYEAWRAR
jgi:lysophospholipase L1-like esterase